MKILLSGGGTGGHITPVLAVAHELKQQSPDCRIIYVGERGGKFASLVEKNQAVDEVQSVFAGKYRRYHGDSLLDRLLDFKTNFLNFRDAIYFALGTIQAIFLVKKLNPDVVFLKGGFVGVPVGLAAALWKKKIVTHDSDAMPGLANRLVSRWVSVHATGMPAEYYNYPKQLTQHVGVLVSGDYVHVDDSLQRTYKTDIDLPPQSPLMLVTGGSLGAQRLNAAIRKLAPQLLSDYPDLRIIHQVGRGNAAVYDDLSHDRLRVLEFLSPMYKFTGAADIVVTRAGANTLAELGVQGKACIVVPNPQLAGGHQLRNADHLKSQNAVEVIDETALKQGAEALGTAIVRLLDDSARRRELAKSLSSITIADASHKLAVLLLDVAQDSKNN